MRKTTMLAALAALLPCAALADTQDCRIDEAGTRTYPVALERGRDYALTAAHEDGPDVTYALRAAGGATLATFGHDAGEMFEGRTFRAPYAGTYFVDVTATGDADLWPRWCVISLERDLPADRTTRGTLPVGVTRPGKAFNFDGDRDWFATSLAKGHRYLARLTGPGFLAIRGPQGRVVASAYAFTGTNQTDLPFTAPGSGVFFVEAIDQDGDQAGYSISLTRR